MDKQSFGTYFHIDLDTFSRTTHLLIRLVAPTHVGEGLVFWLVGIPRRLSSFKRAGCERV